MCDDTFMPLMCDGMLTLFSTVECHLTMFPRSPTTDYVVWCSLLLHGLVWVLLFPLCKEVFVRPLSLNAVYFVGTKSWSTCTGSGLGRALGYEGGEVVKYFCVRFTVP